QCRQGSPGAIDTDAERRHEATFCRLYRDQLLYWCCLRPIAAQHGCQEIQARRDVHVHPAGLPEGETPGRIRRRERQRLPAPELVPVYPVPALLLVAELRAGVSV